MREAARRRVDHAARLPRPPVLHRAAHGPYRRYARRSSPMFVEEPIQPGDPGRHAHDRANGQKCPIATGERLLTPKEFEDLLRVKAVTYIQPDLCHCGGLTRRPAYRRHRRRQLYRRLPAQPDGADRRRGRPAFRRRRRRTSSSWRNRPARCPGTTRWSSTPIQRVDGYWQLPDQARPRASRSTRRSPAAPLRAGGHRRQGSCSGARRLQGKLVTSGKGSG